MINSNEEGVVEVIRCVIKQGDHRPRVGEWVSVWRGGEWVDEEITEKRLDRARGQHND